MEKHYYSPFKEGTRFKHYFIIAKLIRKILGFARCRGLVPEFKEPLPQEPLFICPNHARDFGPYAVDKCHKRPYRVWSNPNIIRVRTIPKHVMDKILVGRKGFVNVLCKIGALASAIPMSCVVRSYEPIPAYADTRISDTIARTVKTLEDGKDVVIFPECSDRAVGYKYVNQVKRGIAYSAKAYIEKTNKPAIIVPVYVCQSLMKMLYGTPIIIKKFENFARESRQLALDIMNQIEELGKSLPTHKITPYDDQHRGDPSIALY